MPERLVLALLVVFFAIGCATAPVILTPAGVACRSYENPTLKIRLPLPADWRADWKTEPTAMLTVHAPDDSASLVVTLDPLASAAEKVLEDAQKYAEARQKSAAAEPLEGKFNGHRAVGYRIRDAAGTITVFAIDHDRGIYLLILTSRSTANQQTLDFILERLLFIEE